MTDNRTTEPTTTEHLRALLDERGVEWKSGRVCNNNTSWNVGDSRIIAKELTDGTLLIQQYSRKHLTPEQAIAATLGSECDKWKAKAEEAGRAMNAAAGLWAKADAENRELRNLAHNAWSMALCAMQGMPIPADWGNSVEQGLRKYGINVDMELEGFKEDNNEND